MSAIVHYSASAAAQRLIDTFGRTEDVQFSPSNRRLAVAGFGANRIAVFEVSIGAVAGRTTVDLGEVIEIEGPTLRRPHGLCFLDEDTLAVANREGIVEVLAVPAPGAGGRSALVAATRSIGGSTGAAVAMPGSVAAVRLDDDTMELLVCNNYVHRVTRHLLDRRNGFAARADELFLAKRLDIPDGICVSGDGRWIAISNHNTRSVLLYDRNSSPHPGAEPAGVLRNVLCPHGVRFTADQEFILVADAGAPFVNVYKRRGDSWCGTHDPVRMFPLVSDAVFLRGRHNPQEGGPKGIDISKDGTLLAMTCEHQTLAFFNLDEILRVAEVPANRLRRYMRWRLSNVMFNRFGYMPRRPGMAR